jgi:ABC-type transport system involved in multi-copper enzyme maturation permease subunit
MNAPAPAGSAPRFLPVVRRELQVAARGRIAGRVRLATTLFAVVMALVGQAFTDNVGAPRHGAGLFLVLTAFAFGLALLAGVFVTADCLSEEKRAGTLGFLFLSGLRGYDVVLGKFAARGLNPLYAMLAMLPVTALALVMGGVTAGEVVRTALVLVNTLFLSLAAGMWVSAGARESLPAVVGTMAVLLALLAAHAVGARAGMIGLRSWATLAWLSPSFTFLAARPAAYFAGASGYWASLAITHGLAWLLLALASRKIQSTWQDRPEQVRARAVVAARPQRRPPLGDGAPLPWLLRVGEGPRWWLWAVAGVWAVAATGPLRSSMVEGFDPLWLPVFVAAKLVALLFKIVFAAMACRFMVEARRSGTVEMILSTPLTDAEILRSQWRHLWRWFGGPVALFCVPLCLRTLLGGDHLGMALGTAMSSALTGFGSGVLLALNTVVDFVALGWVGMWLAVSLKRPVLAPGLTVLLVLVLPTVLFCVPAFVVDVLFIAWARHRLAPGFRKLVSEAALPGPIR